METDHVAAERRLLDEALESGAAALDVGCGRTTRLRFFRDRIARLVGADPDEAAGRENPFLDEFVVAGAEELPFEEASFDLVYANFVVEHLERPDGALAEFARVLRPDGRLVVVTTNRANPFMRLADALPSAARVAVKRGGAGVEERDVYPTRYLANTPDALARATRAAGFAPVAVEYVATLHRYGARLPGAGTVLRTAERALPARRRSTIVGSYRRVDDASPAGVRIL